jgi:hypothetical protein
MPRESQYTVIGSCPIVEKDLEETGFQVTECEGLAEYRLRLVDSDARHNLIVIAPNGQETDLGLLKLFGGAFSTLGTRVEWRGDRSNNEFQPTGMILRYDVFDHPERPKQPTSYLVTVSLKDAPCVVTTIAPGEGQNGRARRAVDRALNCADGRAAKSIHQDGTSLASCQKIGTVSSPCSLGVL